MKISTVLVIFCTLQLSANIYGQTKKFDLTLADVTVKEVLKNIESQSEFRFFYNDELSEVNRTLSIDKKEILISDLMSYLFDGTGVTYKVLENNLVVISPETLMQQKLVKGKVVDAESLEPLAGVTVQVEGTNLGITTGIDGTYEINAPSGDNVLVFSFIGYVSQKVPIAQRSVVDVSLVLETQTLDEVVVIGYGVQRKSVVTGAISSIKTDDLMNSSVVRAEQALAGKTSGVQVIQNSGAPGAELNVRIRGYGSNRSSEPIYIVNGTRVNSISTIDPNDISNIEILKDAASAAIYGAEGANGVVLVTTKGGISGQGRLTYEYQHSIQSMANKIDVLNGAEYYDYFTEAGSVPLSADRTYDTDWQNEIFETTPAMKHYLSFTGGSERSSFLMSLSYLDQDGIVKGEQDRYKRYTAMFNSEYKVNNWIKAGHNISYTRTDLQAVSENSEYGSVISAALMLDPLTPISYRDNNYPAAVQALINANQVLLKDADGYIYGISQHVNGEVGNPFVHRDRSKSAAQNNMLFGNVYFDLTPLKGLTITSRLGLTLGFNNTHTYNPVYYYNTSQVNNASSVSETMTLSTFWQWDTYATYVKSFGKHNTTFLVGLSPNQLNFKYMSGDVSPLTVDSDLFDDLSYGVANPTDNVSGYRNLTRKLSYFGRFNYDYAGKYLFQFSLRRDAAGADVLSAENRWGTFPAVSAGWVLSNESFFPQSFISFAKLRASWGQNGSLSGLNGYPYASLLSSSGASFPVSETSLAIGTYPSTLSNLSLGWERSEQTDIGLDIRAFKDKLSVSIDYYNKVTKDLITTGTPPLISGNNATNVNAGDVQNKGIEFELGYRNKINDFNYSINVNFATLHNEVTYMNPNNPRLTGSVVNLHTATMFEVGYPIWYFYGWKIHSINPETGNPVYYTASGDTSSVVVTGDKQYIGSGIPKLTYGATINMGYKGFDFKAFMQGQSGNDIMVGMVRTDRLNFNLLKVFYEDRWTASNTDGTMPKASNSEANKWHSDLMLFNGSFLKVKQIQLGYNIPKSVLSKIKASNARAYISLENALTFTKYPGMDPEVGSTTVSSIGIDRGMYPIYRVILLGASITF